MWVLRADFEELAKSKGHSVDNAVSWDTNYLVTDDPGRMTKKRKAAQQLNVPVIDSESFLQMMGGQIELKNTLGL